MSYSYMSSREAFERAQDSIPGGVNSPVRAFKSVGGTPLFMERAAGAYLWDIDGNRYIDYINSWGPMILGHAYTPVTEAIREKAITSTSFGAPTLLELEMAELLKSMVPGLDMVRMVNSGTEACMSALRLARGYTGRNKFIKFEGCYHGHADSFLVKAGSGLATFDIQEVPGIPAKVSGDTISCIYNDLESVRKAVQSNKDEIAAIIVEPVAGNMGCVPPQPDFLQGLRQICDRDNILLIFDEVMTGFRLAQGGAQELFGIPADLVTFGKIVGGGLPVGAFGGKRAIMEHVAPLGKVYQAGTLSGNPLAMIAGYTLLSTLKNNTSIYTELEQKSATLKLELGNMLIKAGIPHRIHRVGSMISVFFSDHDINCFEDVQRSNVARFNKFFHAMLGRGVYLPPSAFETWFLSNALHSADIDATLTAAKQSIEELSRI